MRDWLLQPTNRRRLLIRRHPEAHANRGSLRRVSSVIRININKLLLVTCVAILAGILVAGLWPFTPFPRNQVSWSKGEKGLHFGDYGTILGGGTFTPVKSPQGSPCSLEIWSRPGLIKDTNTMLAFYGPDKLVSFSLGQSISDLVLRREFRNRQGQIEKLRVYADYVFQQNKDAFITVTSGKERTLVYLDGALVRSIPGFGVSTGDLVGQLVVANSPVANDSWSGWLQGLAIFDRELSAAEVIAQYESWTKTGQPSAPERKDARALYLFTEGKGNVIHNEGSNGPDLDIPDHYLVLHQPFLQRPWDEFRPTLGYVEDVLVNIGGFVPLGFFFCAYFLSVRRLSHPMLVTILLGGVVSFSIETLQAFIPTRDSGMTDIITNTLGTAVGAVMYASNVCQALVAKSRYHRALARAVSNRVR